MRPSSFEQQLESKFSKFSKEANEKLQSGRESITEAFAAVGMSSNKLYEFLQSEFGSQLGEQFSQNADLPRKNYMAYVIHFLDERNILSDGNFWFQFSLKFNVSLVELGSAMDEAEKLAIVRKERMDLNRAINVFSQEVVLDERLPKLEDYTNEAMATQQVDASLGVLSDILSGQHKYAGDGFFFGKKGFDYSSIFGAPFEPDSNHYGQYEESGPSHSTRGHSSEEREQNGHRSSSDAGSSWNQSKPPPSGGYYEALGLDTNEMAGLSNEQAAKKVKSAYRKQIAKNHPDRFEEAEKLQKQEEMKQANLAREALMKKYGAA